MYEILQINFVSVYTDFIISMQAFSLNTLDIFYTHFTLYQGDGLGGVLNAMDVNLLSFCKVKMIVCILCCASYTERSIEL